MYTVDDYTTSGGRFIDRLDWQSPAMQRNAKVLVDRVNGLLLAFGQDRKISSGFRTIGANRELKNASPYSRHLTGEAIDIEDTNGSLKRWLNAKLLERFGLYAEAFEDTPTWVHLQTNAPASKKRIFNP